MKYNVIKNLINGLGVYPDLTKDYILRRVSQEEIFEKYINIPINKETLGGSSVKSPFRSDKNPTCNYWYNHNGKLRFRDWSGDFHGDCFDAVARKIGLANKDKYDFIVILHTIAKDFRIHKYVDTDNIAIYNTTLQTLKDSKEGTRKKTTLKFNITPRIFNYHDNEYWGKKYRLSVKDLPHVYPAQEIYITKNGESYRYYSYSTKDPAYCYYGGKSEDGVDMWKIYFPLRGKGGGTRFISNHSFLQGKQLITCGRVGVITKAYKDVLCFRKYGIQAVAPSAESVILTKDEYFFMKTKFDFLVSCMDYDATGISSSIKHRDKYNIMPIMFTKGRFGQIDFKAKDFSDYIENNDDSKVIDLLRTNFSKYEHDFKFIDNYYKNSIGWIK